MSPTPTREPRLSDLIGTVEVCQWADIDRATLSRHIALGKLTPAMRIGNAKNGAMLFDRKQVAAYIATIKPERVA
jgi:predicted site-specific integrase-resolvase